MALLNDVDLCLTWLARNMRIQIALAALTLFAPGCAVGIGASHTVPTMREEPREWGLSFGLRAQLPRSYRGFAALEMSHHAHAWDGADQWRVGVGAGWSRPVQVVGPWYGYEAGIYSGVLRGGRGEHLSPIGAWHGVRLGLPLRISGGSEAVDADGLLNIGWALVPEIGSNVLWGKNLPTQTEVTASLGLRVILSPGILP